MIESTQRKFRETDFFLRHLVKENRVKMRPNDSEHFLFYLSAFLSAARSITFVLQKEERGKYDTWFATWKGNLLEDDQKLLKDMNRQRVAEVKKDGATVRIDHQDVPKSASAGVDREYAAGRVRAEVLSAVGRVVRSGMTHTNGSPVKPGRLRVA